MEPIPPPSILRAAPAAASVPASAGIGLRFPHHGLVVAQRPESAWFEVHPENYMTDAPAAETLEAVRHDYPLSLHAVGLSLGSADGIDPVHLERLSAAVDRFQPGLVSDHLSWSAAGGMHLPDLLPLPYTQEALDVVRANVGRAQDILKRPLLIENPSTYLSFASPEMSEAEFLGRLVRGAGCGVLLDINNISVSARNRGEDPLVCLHGYLEAIPHPAIGEIHLAGHAVRRLDDGAELRIDDHGSAICAEVWRLFEAATNRLGPRPTLIEWDTTIPAFAVLQGEAAAAQAILDAAQEEPRRALG